MAKNKFKDWFAGLFGRLRKKVVPLPQSQKMLNGYLEQVNIIKEAINLFLGFNRNQEQWRMLAARIKDCEKRCDSVTRRINIILDDTFITPFERGDISGLAGLIDDVMDHLEKAANRIVIYKVSYDPVFSEYLKQFLNLLSEAMEELKKIFILLHDLRQAAKIREYCQNIHQLEEEADSVYRHSLEKLAETQNPLLIIFWQDILGTLEHSMDKCHVVSKNILGILSNEAV
ncbi:MAG: DUF47 family protein [Patescibacteria group bacterium]